MWIGPGALPQDLQGDLSLESRIPRTVDFPATALAGSPAGSAPRSPGNVPAREPQAQERLTIVYGSQMIAWPRGFSEALAAGGRFVIEFDNRCWNRVWTCRLADPPALRPATELFSY